MPDFQSLAQAGIQRLRAYDPGHDIVAMRKKYADLFFVELGSNENTYGPSPRAREVILDNLHALHRYPDPLGADLKKAIALKHSIKPEQILLGNGSHELLMMIAQVFAGPGTQVLASQYGFAVYALAAQCAGAELVIANALPADAEQSRGHDLHALSSAINEKTRVVYIANPNNPTGTWYSSQAFAEFIERVPANVLVVVDEAYLEFVTAPELQSALALSNAYQNLIVARTFSKAYGLAGLRVGYIVAHPECVAVMERVRESFNVNLLGLAAAEAALGDDAHVQWVLEKNAAERAWLIEQFQSRGLKCGPSQTNFILIDFQKDSADIEAKFVNSAVVLRPMRGYGLPSCLRVTVGNRDENRQLLKILDEVMA
ncbi:MAG TPA: histidinol-phosphate transaminase [Arenimonas sp.]|nr:histidinol-phosphate transaminase [Arenimonas sp.]HOZ04463.1 histidinol-phosphate transaminase [Arenimonas sp.]HPW31290.1 histidinol-phosphate transaminase [Arenimonas sp.]